MRSKAIEKINVKKTGFLKKINQIQQTSIQSPRKKKELNKMVAQIVKNLCTMQETKSIPLAQEDPLERE